MKIGSGFDVQAFLVSEKRGWFDFVPDAFYFDALPKAYRNALCTSTAAYNFSAKELWRHLTFDAVWGHVSPRQVRHIVEDVDRKISAVVKADQQKFCEELKDRYGKKTGSLRDQRAFAPGGGRIRTVI